MMDWLKKKMKKKQKKLNTWVKWFGGLALKSQTQCSVFWLVYKRRKKHSRSGIGNVVSFRSKNMDLVGYDALEVAS